MKWSLNYLNRDILSIHPHIFLLCSIDVIIKLVGTLLVYLQCRWLKDWWSQNLVIRLMPKAQKCHGTQSTEFGLIVVWPISMVWDWASQPPHPHPGKDYFDPDEEVFTISLVLETAFSLHLGFQLTKNLEPSLSCALFWTLFFYSDGCYDNANENMRSVFFQQWVYASNK